MRGQIQKVLVIKNWDQFHQSGEEFAKMIWMPASVATGDLFAPYQYKFFLRSVVFLLRQVVKFYARRWIRRLAPIRGLDP